VVNNLITGRVYASIGMVDSALSSYDHVLQVAPENRRVHYQRGQALMKGNRLDEAEKSFMTYLGSDSLEDWQRAETAYRLGQLYYRKKEYGKAEEQWKAAVKINGSPAAKVRLEKLKSDRKEGKIPA
jgi:tetratricopeptide (TPR) repeat protein